MTPCTVTGVLTAPDDTPLPGAVAVFLPAPVGARARGSGLSFPLPSQVTASGLGQIEVDLLPGVYTLRVTDGRREYPAALVDVPQSAAATLPDLLVTLPVPQSVYDAAASARRAALAAAAVEDLVFAGEASMVLTLDGETYSVPIAGVGGGVASVTAATADFEVGGITYTVNSAVLGAI